MDNNTARRQAQKLIQKGQYAEAAEAYAKLAEASQLEPYDLVVFADLLNRNGDRESSLARYVEAMDSYAEAGLHRNAIALGKKVQRLASDFTFAHRKLGDLYAAEGLSSESCLHYLEYLEKIDLKDQANADEVEEVCARLLDLSLPSFDVVNRILQVAKGLGREKALAPGILKQARQAANAGNTDVESKLQKLALELDPDLARETGDAASEGSAGFLDPGQVDLDASAPDETPSAKAQGEPDVISLDGFSFGDDEDDRGGTTSGDAAEEATSPRESGIEVESLGDLGKMELEGNLSLEDEEETVYTTTTCPEGDIIRDRALESLQNNETVRAQMEFMKAAVTYFEAGLSLEAGVLYERVVNLDPNHLEALTGLVEIAHINGEKAKMTHWGCELGDVLLAREKYPEAKVQFERVLAFDPNSEKARLRVKRLNTIAGVREASFGELGPAASEVEGAKVTVRDDGEEMAKDPSSQSALDLSQILDEFRAAVVDSIPFDDARSHFDLGMTYQEMGLFAEAAQEFEISSENKESRLASLEMLGECYLQLDRYEEAVRALEEFLGDAPEESRALTHVRLGRSREALGLWDQAEEDYNNALEADADFLQAAELLQDLEQRREQGAA